MKANQMNVSVELWLDCEPDSLNRTVVRLGDFVIWPTAHEESVWPGRWLSVSIPSGTLTGMVKSVREVPEDGVTVALPYLDVQLVDAHWDGMANGLMNGFFACGNWKVAEGTGVVYDSSALPQGMEVAYADYELVRWATDIFEDHAAAMRAVFEAAAAVEYGPAWAEEENAVLFLSHEAVLSVLPEGIADIRGFEYEEDECAEADVEPLSAEVLARLQAMKMGLEVEEDEDEEVPELY